jgi:hypothetical protein
LISFSKGEDQLTNLSISKDRKFMSNNDDDLLYGNHNSNIPYAGWSGEDDVREMRSLGEAARAESLQGNIERHASNARKFVVEKGTGLGKEAAKQAPRFFLTAILSHFTNDGLNHLHHHPNK